VKLVTRSFGHVTLLILVALALFATTPTAQARPHGRTVTKSGTILVGHTGVPVSVLSTGPRYFASCDTNSPVNGVDGVWFKVDKGLTRATLRPVSTLAAYLLFYDNTCAFTGVAPGAYSGIYPVPGAVVSGPVPAGTAFVFVLGDWGTGKFTLRFS
jgi:hypothetical protein